MPSGPNWQVITQPGSYFPGAPSVAGGGYTGAISFRDALDAKRTMAGRTPEAEYPDGYLGTIIDRRQDKLLAKVQERMNDRSYQRGVHVGSKVGRDSYFWPAQLTPDSGLLRQARTAQQLPHTMSNTRFAPSGNPVERLAHLGKPSFDPVEMGEIYRKYNVNPAINPVVIPDPTKQARMRKMLPSYV